MGVQLTGRENHSTFCKFCLAQTERYLILSLELPFRQIWNAQRSLSSCLVQPAGNLAHPVCVCVIICRASVGLVNQAF